MVAEYFVPGICGLTACGAAFPPDGFGRRYCSAPCQDEAHRIHALTRTVVLYPPTAPAARHICERAQCRRRFITSWRDTRYCSLSCAEGVAS